MTEITFRLDDPPEELDVLAIVLETLPSVARLREARRAAEMGAPVAKAWEDERPRDAWEPQVNFGDVPARAIDESQPSQLGGEMPAPPSGWATHESGALIPAEDAAPLDIEPRDSTGTLWDPELHASSKAFTKDGKWRARRNSGGAPPPPPPVAVAPPPPPPPPPPLPAITFAQMMAKLTPGFSDGSLDMHSVNQALGRIGVPNLPALNQSPELIPNLMRELGL